MQEFELNELWKNNDKHSKEYYLKIENKIMELANKNSNSILQKIKNRVLTEWIISFVVVLFVLYVFRNHPNLKILVISILVLSPFVWMPYGKMLKKIKTVPTQNVVTSLETYLEILNDFMRNLKNTFFIITPIFLLLGFYMLGSINSSGISDFFQLNFKRIGIAIVLLIIFMAIVPKYLFSTFYGNPKNELKELLQSLKE